MVFPVQKMGSYGGNTPQKLQKPMRSLIVVSIFSYIVSTEDLFFLCVAMSLFTLDQKTRVLFWVQHDRLLGWELISVKVNHGLK